MKEYIQVFTTAKKKDDADEIARDLVENRLAACAQVIGPINSIYRWKGKIEEEEEWLKDIHPYEEPEILALSLVKGSRGYLTWLDQQVGPSIVSQK